MMGEKRPTSWCFPLRREKRREWYKKGSGKGTQLHLHYSDLLEYEANTVQCQYLLNVHGGYYLLCVLEQNSLLMYLRK